MPSPFPTENDECYDPNVDIDRGIEDKLFPPMTVATPDADRLAEERFWELFEPKDNPSPSWFCRPDEL